MKSPATMPGPKCPICNKPATPANKPFCSPRCAEVDLGRWLTETYTLPAKPDPEDPDPA